MGDETPTPPLAAPIGETPLALEVPAGMPGRRSSASVDLRRALYRFRQSRLSVFGLALLSMVVAVALIGPNFVPYPEDATGALRLEERLSPPSLTHFFGTDTLGRDNFSRVIVGSQLSLLSAVAVVLLAGSLGTIIGAAAGYFGGLFGEFLMRFTDIVMTIPSLILALTIAATLGASTLNSVMAIGLARWPQYARLTHGQVLSLREQLYVDAARSMGAGHKRILFLHIIPNAASTLIVQASLDFGSAILTVAALGFLGLGVRPPTPEWGAMVSEGRGSFPMWWWNATFPGLAIFVTVLAGNLIGDGLRDVFDPRTRR
jgi:peptide/nickel transport system permease protein